MPLTVAANVSMLFTEHPFLDRFAAAKHAGFTAVEFWWPGGEHLPDVIAAVPSDRAAMAPASRATADAAWTAS